MTPDGSPTEREPQPRLLTTNTVVIAFILTLAPTLVLLSLSESELPAMRAAKGKGGATPRALQAQALLHLLLLLPVSPLLCVGYSAAALSRLTCGTSYPIRSVCIVSLYCILVSYPFCTNTCFDRIVLLDISILIGYIKYTTFLGYD